MQYSSCRTGITAFLSKELSVCRCLSFRFVAELAHFCCCQEVEYVKQEAKLVYLLECLQKTAPPVLVFAEKTSDVDDIHEYLLVKGVEAVAVHGGKDQEEREAAIDAFKVCVSLLLLSCCST